jgi:hypothetical protein
MAKDVRCIYDKDKIRAQLFFMSRLSSAYHRPALRIGGIAMIFLYPLKPFERLWDRIEKSKGIPKRLKSLLLTLLTVAMLAQNFVSLRLIKQFTERSRALHHVSLAACQIKFAFSRKLSGVMARSQWWCGWRKEAARFPSCKAACHPWHRPPLRSVSEA